MPDRPSYTIRRARARDETALQGFHRRLYLDERQRFLATELRELGDYIGFEEQLSLDLRALLRDDDARVLLAATADGAAIGYVTGRLDRDPHRRHAHRAVVEDWYVRDDHRGQGVGVALLEAFTAEAKQQGCTVLESATWPGNARARQLHERHGFAAYEVRMRKAI